MKEVNEMTSIADVISFDQYGVKIEDVIAKTVSRSITSKICYVKETTSPRGFLYGLTSGYSPNDEKTKDPYYLIETETAISGTVTTNAGVINVILSEEKYCLVELLSGTLKAGDTIGTNHILHVSANRMAMRMILKEYSKMESDLDRPAETTFAIDRVQLDTYIRKVRSKFSQEGLQDMKSHIKDAESDIENLIVNEIADSIDQDIISYMIDVSTKYPDETFGRIDSQLVLNTMSRIGFDILAKTRKSLSMFAIISPKVASTLLSSYQYSFQNTETDHDVSESRYIGEIGVFKTYVNINAKEDGILIGYKDKGVFEAGMCFSPYNISTFNVVNPEDAHGSLVHSVRAGFALNPLDSGRGSLNSSDFFGYAKINIQD